MQGFGRRTLRLGVDYLDIYQQARLVKVGVSSVANGNS